VGTRIRIRQDREYGAFQASLYEIMILI